MYSIGVSYGKFATSKSGGARESLLTLLNGIADERDFHVTSYHTPPADDPPKTSFDYRLVSRRLLQTPRFSWVNQVFTRWQWRRFLRSNIATDHDVLLTQNELAPATIQVADQLEIPSIFFLRSLALTGDAKYTPQRGHLSNFLTTDLGGKIQYPLLYWNFNEYRHAARMATVAVANSEFTARRINELFAIDSTVIYPPIDLDKFRVEYNPGGRITMVNPRASYKGADIFLDIADESPEEEFLLVGPIHSTKLSARASDIPNVTHWSWRDDMREAYGVTKIIVVPSRVEESFGRIPAEAMVSGIPCAVSNRGGLPEVVGETGEIVSDIENTEAWLESINTALTNHDPAAQQERVKRFGADRQCKKFDDIIKSVI